MGCIGKLKLNKKRKENWKAILKQFWVKPLEDVLRSIFKSSPSLSALFLTGSRLANPRDQRPGGGDKGNGNGTGKGKGAFKGKLHPTFFKFKKKEYGELFHRDCEIGRRCRIDFETDVTNDYFDRVSNPGRFILEMLEGDRKEEDMDWSLTLHNSIAHASICIPEDVVSGDKMTVQFTVEDDVILDSFVNIAILHVRPKLERRGGGRRNKNSKGGGEKNEPSPAGIDLPNITQLKKRTGNDMVLTDIQHVKSFRMRMNMMKLRMFTDFT